MCSGYSFRKFIMLASRDFQEVEQLIAVESDEELENISLEPKADYLPTVAEVRRANRFDFDSCSPQRFHELFRFEKKDLDRLQVPWPFLAS